MRGTPPCFLISVLISSVFRDAPMAILLPFNPFPNAIPLFRNLFFVNATVY
ncbi:hypothetical protein CHCC14596_2661 [Bacillus licheniformis]|nr:hypothetical protein CHCC14596_2661 [Bacillus licheniformis]TWN27838.1 hypothetical protein CHCC14557_1418 [Bacillus licheniformis]